MRELHRVDPENGTIGRLSSIEARSLMSEPRRSAADPVREEVLTQTFVQLADSLVEGFDIIDLLAALVDRCVELLHVAAAGIVLADGAGSLHVMVASSEEVHRLEVLQIQTDEGPCPESYSTGAIVSDSDLRVAQLRWPRFATEAVGQGFLAVSAVPLRLRSRVIGALNLFHAAPGLLPQGDVRLAQAMADVASIAIVQDQALRAAEVRSDQLQHALDSRVAIEQAKGMLSERAQVGMDEAFGRLRSYARSNNRRLTAVAAEIVRGALPIEVVAGGSPRRTTD
jgi:transcriptional regulator with GAF, ATPase, and Fis domain